jgi:pectinesterase
MRITFVVLIISVAINVAAQSGKAGTTANFTSLPWKTVATRMGNAWYASDTARQVAATVLFCQQDIGGWPKNKPYHHPLSGAERQAIQKNRSGIGATIDNGATTTEMKFLANMYTATGDVQYFLAFEKGLNYLLTAQYGNGGWPQYYPLRTGSTAYANHITYNDNAMVNVLQLLSDIAEGDASYAKLPITATMQAKAKQAFDKGVECILNTQIKINGKLTVWCAQHDAVTLLPAKARAYELPSFSGQESVGIVQLLMQVKDPSARVIAAVTSAMEWLHQHRITGIRVENRPGADGKKNMVVIDDERALPLLARFYDLDTAKPFFTDRDGIKRDSLNQIGTERRNGYSWYNDDLVKLQKQYTAWQKQHVNAP